MEGASSARDIPVRRTGLALRATGVLALLTAFAANAPLAAGTTSASQLVGGGESWAKFTAEKLFTDAIAANQTGGLTKYFNEARGESDARADLATGRADFALTEAPLTPDEQTVATQNHITPAYVPYGSGAVAFVTSIQLDGNHGGKFLSGLRLTIPTLAKIFTHRLTAWNDPEIVAENPDLADNLQHNLAKTRISAVVRADSSATTTALVAMFKADPDAAAIWNNYVTGHPMSDPDKWPADQTSVSVIDGSQGVINTVLHLDVATGQPIWGATDAMGNIGYVAPAWATQFGAPVVAVQNLSKSQYALPTSAAVSSALHAGATFDATTGLYAIDYSKITAADAYPIPLVSYFIVPVQGVSAGKAAPLASFLKFVLGTTGQQDVASTGMVAATDEALTAGRKVVDALTAVATTTTSSTTTSSTSSTTSTTTRPTTTTTATGGATTTAAPVAGASAGSAGGDPAGSSLPFTGGGAWPLLASGVLLLSCGEWLVRRARRALG